MIVGDLHLARANGIAAPGAPEDARANIGSSPALSPTHLEVSILFSWHSVFWNHAPGKVALPSKTYMFFNSQNMASQAEPLFSAVAAQISV